MNTFLFTVVSLIVFVALYFAGVRYLINIKSVGEKIREFLQFLMHYIIVFVVMVFVLYAVKLGDSRESWELSLYSVLSATFMTFSFCFFPTFLLAYFLYPFKFINKRSKSSMRLLIAALAAIFLIWIVMFAVALSFSNM